MRVQLKESIKVDNVILPRRAFLKGLLSLFAAPAIVKVESLMPVVVWRPTFRRMGGTLGWPYFLATARRPLTVGAEPRSPGAWPFSSA